MFNTLSLFIVSSFICSVAFATDRLLLKSIRSFESISPNANECAKNLQEACPEVLRNSLKDMYRRGTAGTINAIVSDGSMKNPRTACNSAATHSLKQDQAKLNQQLETHYSKTPQLYDYTQRCSENLGKWIDDEYLKTDKSLAQSYMQYDFNFKSLALHNALTNLLDSRAQIGLVLQPDAFDCHSIRMMAAQKQCLVLSQCRPPGNKQHFLNIKTEEVDQALASLRTLNQEALKTKDREKVRLIREDMERIKDLNPMLKGEKFKILVNNLRSVPTTNQLQTAITEQLKLSQKEINTQLKQFTRAHACLIGASRNCDDFEEIMSKTRYQHPDVIFPKANELNYAATFHQCIENIKDNRNTADVVLDDVAVNLALTLTPYAVVNGVKLAGTLARTASITSKMARAQNVAGKAGLAANIGYGGYHTVEEFERCQAEVKRFQGLSAAPGKMSCDSVEKIFVSNSNNSRCINQALISAALLTPIAANSLRLAKHLPKIAPEKLKELVSKIRTGKSLTKEEELLLLAKIKGKNPLEKLMLKGISKADKEFASKALEKLYKQEHVSPEDLLKLSKLIKPRNPPLLLVTRQDNVDDILNSKRIWGSTEGSVYGAAKPAETAMDKLKTGVHGDKEGTFIFTPEAAALFKSHEVTGLYSGIKRAAGQYKGPFGDIIIEEAKRIMVNGRPHIIVTKARRAAGTATEKLHVGQSTARAEARLLGRRAGIDTIATGTGAIVTIQASSAFTGTNVSDLLMELLEE
ncbi:hypothetical protein ACJVC5_03600 [Peredibacter sp. HCB2-198]|uniref:hypothetical protein n=1 Tax=Peredibacter sp. HCB2-198 TaxID=3383025 RepID=UPI0038B6232D